MMPKRTLTVQWRGRLKKRQPLAPLWPGSRPTGYMESDRDWVTENLDACVAFLQAATGSK